MMLSEIGDPRSIVLIVDDSTQELEFLTDAIEQMGFSVLVATSGRAALKIVERITPDIVLLDAVMPELDGFATCLHIKSSGSASQVPVIFITGLSETEHIVRALETGGVDYLTKPINIDELRARIRVHLANAQSTRNAQVALDAAGRYLLAIGKDGRLRWITPQATRLLISTMGSAEQGQKLLVEHISNRMKSGVRYAQNQEEAVAISGASGGVQLSYLGELSADEHLFRLTSTNRTGGDQQLRQHFSLTAREAEVLLWISKGKTNRDIAEIIGLSARTVNKHLEQVYVKMGVENRAAAAVKAVRILHDG